MLPDRYVLCSSVNLSVDIVLWGFGRGFAIFEFMILYSNKWLSFLFLLPFFVTIEGQCESLTLTVPMMQSSDQSVELLVHPDDNSLGLNRHYPNVPSWLNSIFKKENKSEISRATFVTDQAILKEKIKQDSCLAEFAKAVRSGSTSKQFNNRMEIKFDSYELEEALAQYYGELQGLPTLPWARRGVVAQQVPRILKIYKEQLPKQKLIIDYLRTGEHYFLQLNLVYPGVELMERNSIVHKVGDELDIRSCKITDESLDRLARVYFLFLKNLTTDY